MIEPGPEFFTPARRERRRKLLELAKASFPDGMPLPYTTIVVKSTVSSICTRYHLDNIKRRVEDPAT
jgi:hypothetical protein